ncbi:MAG: hypothetical protein NVS4B3_01590 [Gemmatimonadaceae bacterium]
MSDPVRGSAPLGGAPRDATRGYGNIYTPHAGSMVIQVQREGGLANRTFVLSERGVKLLRFAFSRIGVTTGVVIATSWLFFAVQAVRVPILTHRLAFLERDAQRLDTLQATLGRLQHRYDQLQKMFGAPVAASARSSAPLAGSGEAASGLGGAVVAVAPVATPIPETPVAQVPVAVPPPPNPEQRLAARVTTPATPAAAKRAVPAAHRKARQRRPAAPKVVLPPSGGRVPDLLDDPSTLSAPPMSIPKIPPVDSSAGAATSH